MGNYFSSQYNKPRSRYELNVVKFIKSYEYFAKEIKRLSEVITSSTNSSNDFDNNIIQLHNSMKGFVESVSLYGNRIGIINKFSFPKNTSLSAQVNSIFCSKNINEFVEKYSAIINDDKFPPMKRRKMLISRNFKNQLAEEIEKIELPKTSKGYMPRVKALIGSVVEKSYGRNAFDIPTCNILPNKDRSIKLKSDLPIFIEKEFDRLGLTENTNQKLKPFIKSFLFSKPKNTSILGARVYGNAIINEAPSDCSVLAAAKYGSAGLDKTNGR